MKKEAFMNRTISAMLLSGGLLAGAGVPQTASAHGSDEFVSFVAGSAFGFLLNEAVDDDHHHHHTHYRPAYVVAPPPPVYYAPPTRVYHHHVYEAPRYYRHEGHRKHWRKHHRRYHDD
jgi:hypothetical protein